MRSPVLVPAWEASSARVVCSTSFPCETMTTSSTVSSISDRRWDETSTACPIEAWWRMNVRSHWIPCGSRPLDGSSRMRISGSPSRAVASWSRWRIPRENLPTRRRATSDSPTSSRVSSTLVSGMPGRHGHRPQVVPGPARRVEAGGLEHGPHVLDGMVEVHVPASAEGGGALRDRDQPEQHAQGGGLARPVGPEEAGHPAGHHLEAQVVDGPDRAEPLGQAVDFDGRGHVRRYPDGRRRSGHLRHARGRPPGQTWA